MRCNNAKCIFLLCLRTFFFAKVKKACIEDEKKITNLVAMKYPPSLCHFCNFSKIAFMFCLFTVSLHQTPPVRLTTPSPASPAMCESFGCEFCFFLWTNQKKKKRLNLPMLHMTHAILQKLFQ